MVAAVKNQPTGLADIRGKIVGFMKQRTEYAALHSFLPRLEQQ